MATRKIVPRATGEGGIGKATKRWGDSYLGNLDATSVNIAEGQTYDINGSPHTHSKADGIDTFHGVEVVGAISFDPSTHVLSVASITYWYKGTQYTTSSPVTCDLDLTADRDHASATLTANTLYYFRFIDATGKLYWSPSFWDLHEVIPIATVFWNGSAGAVSKESHGYSRNIDWHIWAHLTVGSRYGSGLSLTSPTTAIDGSLQIESGTIYDEDLAISISQSTTMRGYYQASAGVYTFADYSLPYLGTSGAPVYLDTDTYALTTFAANRYACYWVFATADIDRPIAILPSHVSASYSTITAARAEVQPSVSGVNPEWKLIYRWIYSGDGQFQESSDYRLQTSIAGGVSASTTAGAVSFSPSGNVAATNVQTAIEELDTEKSATSHTHSDATTSVAGFMSASDKTKLDGVATGATAYTDALARSAVIASSISDGDTTHAPDGNSVFDALALKSPLASPTFTSTPAAPTASDNTATTQLATTAFAKSQDAVMSRLPDQSVNMTYAASGSTGIAVADNDNIDFGTGNFTLVWRGSLPNWTPTSSVALMQKWINNAGYELAFRATNNVLQLVLNTSTILSSSSPGITDGTTHDIVVVVSVGASNTTIDFYIDGVLNGTQKTIANVGSVNNSSILYVLGTAEIRTAGTCSFAATFNRALSAAEVLDLYRNGISYADKWGSQTSLVTGDNSTFASDTGWWTKGAGVNIADGVCHASSVSDRVGIIYAAISSPFKKYRCTFTINNYTSGGVALQIGGGGISTVVSTNGTHTIEYASTGNATEFYLVAVGTTTLDIDNVSIYEIGATLALEPEGIQNDKWYDSSTNALNASYPAAGWSLARKLNVPRTNTGQPAFLVRSSVDQENIAVGSAVTVVFGTEIFDIGNNFASNTFTAPITGKYQLNAIIYLLNVDTSGFVYVVKILTSNGEYRNSFSPLYSSDLANLCLNISTLCDMDAGDTAYVTVLQDSGTQQTSISGSLTYFSGYLVC